MSKVEKLDANIVSKDGKWENTNTFGNNMSQVRPQAKPNFGNEEEMEFVGNQDPSNLFKS